MKSINRRNFLATTAAFSAFTILKPATAFDSKANSAIRKGIIGCGNRGTEVLSEMIKNTSAQTVAMVDLFDYQLEKAKPVFDKVNIDRGGVAIGKSKIYRGSEAYQRLLTDSAADAVLISARYSILTSI